MLTFDDVKPYICNDKHQLNNIKKYNYFILSKKDDVGLFLLMDDWYDFYELKRETDYDFFVPTYDTIVQWIYAFNELNYAIEFKLRFE